MYPSKYAAYNLPSFLLSFYVSVFIYMNQYCQLGTRVHGRSTLPANTRPKVQLPAPWNEMNEENHHCHSARATEIFNLSKVLQRSWGSRSRQCDLMSLHHDRTMFSRQLFKVAWYPGFNFPMVFPSLPSKWTPALNLLWHTLVLSPLGCTALAWIGVVVCPLQVLN